MAEQLPAQPVKPRGRPKRPQGAQRLRVLTLRVPEELLCRLDAYTAQLQAAQPYLRLSRTDVLRMLLDQGLPAISERAKEKPLADRGVIHGRGIFTR